MKKIYSILSGLGIIKILNIALRLLSSGNSHSYQIEKSINKQKFFDFFKLIQPINYEFNLIRVGPFGDGGYVMPDDLSGISHCISPGVGESTQFESNLSEKYNIRSYLADPTIISPKNLSAGIVFAPIGISYMDGHQEIAEMNSNKAKVVETKTLESFISESIGDCQKELILQMDIENHEYLALLFSRIETLKRFRIMIIEFHSLPKIFSEIYFNQITYPLFRKLNSEFYVAHIHPNNVSRPVKMFGVEVPHAIEVTFHNRNRVKGRNFKKITSFTSKIDYPCNPALPEVILDSNLFYENY